MKFLEFLGMSLVDKIFRIFSDDYEEEQKKKRKALLTRNTISSWESDSDYRTVKSKKGHNNEK